MSNKKDVEKKIKKEYGGLLGIIMNIALIIAALIFVISLFATISEVRRVYENASGSISSMTYSLEADQFGSMASTYYMRNAAVGKVDKDSKYYCDIAEYAHLSFMEKVYDRKGDDKDSKRCAARRQELREGLGEYNVAADKIDKQLNGFPR